MSQIGPYEITEKIGSGGMASVFKAYQPKLDRHVAIKMIHRNFSEDDQFNTRFEREARIVARLDHPHIVPVYDYDEHEGQSYLVMKHVEGITLKDVVRKNPLTPEDALPLIEPIARALDHAHQQGVLHRDIKPSNILIDQRGTPYLTDFGLARIAQQGESSMSVDMVLGTPHYMSPEQADGTVELDARTDVYSLGVVLYEILTGQVPFAGETSHAIIHNHIYTPPPPPSEINPEISPEVEEVILTALAKNPDERHSSAGEMIDDYRKCVRASVIEEKQKNDPDENTIQTQPEGTIQRIVHGFETFGSEMEYAFRDFDKDLDGTDEAKRRFKYALRRGIEASGFSNELKSRVKKITENHEKARKFNLNLNFLDDKDTIDELTDEERIRRSVEKRIKKQQDELQGLIIHAVIYFVMQTFLFHWNPWIAVPWGIGLFAHAFSYYNDHSDSRRNRIEREIEKEKERLGYSKVKNDEYDAQQYVRLTEDGEFTESFVDEQQDKYKRR